MEINISKKDIYWGYAALIFNFGSGLITLPLILNRLSPEEVGMNYLMMSLATMVALFDCGFSFLIGKNVTYILSGAQSLAKVGINNDVDTEHINYHLLRVLIDTAKFIYRRISLIVLVAMLTGGTVYMYHVTEGFTNIENSIWIWLLFSLSTYFSMYFLYYNSLLGGAGLVKESRQATILSKIAYIVICYILLLYGFGLISVIVASLISPFISRYYSHVKFYSKELREALAPYKSCSQEVKDTFEVVWYSTKKLAINAVTAYACTNSGTFICGLFLSLEDVASYGLMVQLFNILQGVSSNLFNTYEVLFGKLRVQKQYNELRKKLSSSFMLSIYMMLFGSLVIISLAPWGLSIIGSKSSLPSVYILIFYAFNFILTFNHSNSAVFISTGNQFPFIKPSIYSAIGIVLLTTVFLYLGIGIVSMVLAPFVVHSIYNHWYWPRWVLREIDMSIPVFIKTGTKCLLQDIRIIK